MLKETTSLKIEETIIKTFEFDDEMVNLYDPSAVDIKKEDILTDILRKLKEYDEIPTMKLNYFNFINEERKLLVSFGLIDRSEKTKESFFSHITGLLKGDFICILPQSNIRASKWLVNMGMNIENGNYEHEGHPYNVLKFKSNFLI
jgi:hypothetical protein